MLLTPQSSTPRINEIGLSFSTHGQNETTLSHCSRLRIFARRALQKLDRMTLIFLAKYSPKGRSTVQEITKELGDLLNRCGEISITAHEELAQFVIRLIGYSHWKSEKRPADLLRMLQEINHGTKYVPVTKKKAIRDRGRKILYITGLFPSIEHAGGLRVFDLIHSMPDDYEIDLFSSYTAKKDKQSFDFLSSKISKVGLAGGEGFCWESLQRWLTEHDTPLQYYDAVHFEWGHSTALIKNVDRFARKTIFTAMECTTRRSFMELSDHLKQGVQQADQIMLSKALHDLIQAAAEEALGSRHSDITIAVTDVDAEFIQRVFGVTARVLTSGVSKFSVYDRLENVKDVQPESNSAMFLGYFDHPPNNDAILWYLEHVHPLIQQQIPDYKVTIVGAGNTSIIKAAAPRDGSVIITGRVEDFVPYIAKSKICLSPLVSGAGIRGKINQYSAINRPTVSTRIGVSGLVYVHGESVFIADAPSTFANSVVSLLKDDKLWENMAKKAASVVLENYSWPKIIETLESYYGE